MLPLTQVLIALAFFVLGSDAIDGEDSALLLSGLIFLALAAANEIVRMVVTATEGGDAEPDGPNPMDTMFTSDDDAG